MTFYDLISLGNKYHGARSQISIKTDDDVIKGFERTTGNQRGIQGNQAIKGLKGAYDVVWKLKQ